MTVDKANTVNAILFMKRVQCTGEECGAWTQTYQALHADIAALEAAEVVAPKENAE
jgi:hypothetical protein